MGGGRAEAMMNREGEEREREQALHHCCALILFAKRAAVRAMPSNGSIVPVAISNRMVSFTCSLRVDGR